MIKKIMFWSLYFLPLSNCERKHFFVCIISPYKTPFLIGIPNKQWIQSDVLVFEGKKKNERDSHVVSKYPGKQLKSSLPAGQKCGAGREKETRGQVD